MFGYKCEECGMGTVHAKTIEGYRTRILGYPFVVPRAVIGVCDHCGAHHFSSREAKRWEDAFYHAVAEGKGFLGAEEISSIRSTLGLSREEFALAIGCTRQSLHNWERVDRKRPQSRMADLLIKLVDESRRLGNVNVLRFLVEQAKNLGVDIRLRRTNINATSMKFKVVKASSAPGPSQHAVVQLAAAEAEPGGYRIEDEAGNTIGSLRFDYKSGDLYLTVVSSSGGQGFEDMVVDLVDKDGNSLGAYRTEKRGDKVILAHETDIRPDRVNQIIMRPTLSGGSDFDARYIGLDRLESLLRENRLHEDVNEELAESSYEEICRRVFSEEFLPLIWDEAVLLLLQDLFSRRPPNRKLFGNIVDAIFERAQLVSRVNDLFFAFIDASASAQKVTELVSKVVASPPTLEAALVAGARIEELRETDARPTEKIAAVLEHLKGDLGVDFGSANVAFRGILDALRQREKIGQIWALVVHEPTGRALALQMQVQTQAGKGEVVSLVDSSRIFESAVRRAREALQGHGFIHKDHDLLYSLSLTTGQYVGNSVSLAAALGGYSAAGGVVFDPYTAATGDILLSGRDWRIGSIGHLPAKLAAARRWGIRRVIIPTSNAGESATSPLTISAAEDLLEAIISLQPAAKRLPGTSLSVRKINKLQAMAQERGWHLSVPQSVQSGLQFTLSPLVPPDLKIVIYSTGAHSPKTHARPEFQATLGELAQLDQGTVPIRKVEQVLTVKDSALRQEIRQVLLALGPASLGQEQYCDYAFKYQDGAESLTVKQYQSGKLVLQGQAGALAKRILEAIAAKYNLRFPQAGIKVDDLMATRAVDARQSVRPVPPVAFPYIGTDESGKGDYFGPMVVAGVWVDENISNRLAALGVRDSKLLSETRCRELAGKIRELLKGLFEEVILVPDRYNDLYEEMEREGKHLNHMLAWGHARAIESVLSRKSAKCAVADQFGDERYIQSRLMEKGKSLELIQIPKGEMFVAVAAASILARDSFLARLDRLSREYASPLPRGASEAVLKAAREFVARHGEESLGKVAKLHHRTTVKVLA